MHSFINIVKEAQLQLLPRMCIALNQLHLLCIAPNQLLHPMCIAPPNHAHNSNLTVASHLHSSCKSTVTYVHSSKSIAASHVRKLWQSFPKFLKISQNFQKFHQNFPNFSAWQFLLLLLLFFFSTNIIHDIRDKYELWESWRNTAWNTIL